MPGIVCEATLEILARGELLDGIEKVLQGLTTMEEIRSVCIR